MTDSSKERVLSDGDSVALGDTVTFFLKNQKLVVKIASVLSVFFAALTIFLIYSYKQEKGRREQIAFEKAQQNAQDVALRINDELLRLGQIVDTIANDLSSGTLPYSALKDRLRQEVNKNPDIFGLGAAFEPGMYSPNTSLYAPYYMKDDEHGEFTFIQVEDSYDYTDQDSPQTAWYTEHVRSGEAVWVEPYLAQAAQTWLAEYIAPFYRDGQAAGVLYIDHSFDTLDNFVKSLDLGEEGYSFILSRNGRFVSHPEKTFLGETILDKANELGNNQLRSSGERALAGESFYIDGDDMLTGQPSWTFYEPVPLAGWSIGVVMDKNVLAIAPNQTKRSLIWITFMTIATLFFVCVLVFRVDQGQVRSLWIVSSLTALFFTFGIGHIWYLEKRFPPRLSNQIVLVNRTNLNKQLDMIDRAFERENLPKPVRIPTGITIETITFGSSNENAVTGYLWQKYPLDFPEEERGFLFTDSLGPWVDVATETYTVRDGQYDVVSWFFIATLRQEPNVEKYPLDQAKVQMQIWPKAYYKNVVLVPDLEGYEFINPTQKPGIVDVLVLEDWYVNRSFFSYRWDDYNSSLGSSRLIRKDYVPDLYFNVIISRHILSPIIAYAITLMVVIGLMFGVMVIDADSAFNVLSYAAALFFVVAVSHVGLRSELQAAGVVYLEQSFIMMYVVLLVVSINSILFYANIEIPILNYMNNLIPKLLYWPVLMGVLLAITLKVFYPPVDPNEAITSIEGQQQQLLESILGLPGEFLSSDKTVTPTEVITTTLDVEMPMLPNATIVSTKTMRSDE